MKKDLMGLEINTDTKAEILKILETRLNKKTFITTVYSEFCWHAYRDYEFKKTINSSDLALPDGISIQWLSYYLSISLTLKNFYLKILQALWQEVSSLSMILIAPARIRTVIAEKIPGSVFFWDLLGLAEQKNLSVFFLGGFEDTPMLVAETIKARYPSLKISGYSNSFADPSDQSKTDQNQEIVDKINRSQTDILFVAYGPVKQEKWIYRNLTDLNIKIAIGVGGTFDYVARKKLNPPDFIRKIGLEWLFRLIVQPKRLRRIWRATFRFLLGALRYKVFMTTPFRQNVAGVIINEDQKVLMIGQRVKIDQEFKQERFRVGNSSLNNESENEDKNSPNLIRWQLPQGGIDPGETPEQALLREMREETGMKDLKIIGQANQTFNYIWPHYIRPLFNARKYKGQTQKIYFLKYGGDNSDIKMEATGFEYQWVEPNLLAKEIDPIRGAQLNYFLPELLKYLNLKQFKQHANNADK